MGFFASAFRWRYANQSQNELTHAVASSVFGRSVPLQVGIRTIYGGPPEKHRPNPTHDKVNFHAFRFHIQYCAASFPGYSTQKSGRAVK